MQMGVSKNRGTPKWMVYNGKPYEQMDDLGGPPLFLETPKFNLQNLHPRVDGQEAIVLLFADAIQKLARTQLRGVLSKRMA